MACREVCSSSDSILDSLKWVSQGPRLQAMSYMGYIINGYWFHARDVEKSTQNNGVTLYAYTACQSSARDTSQVVGRISYFGVIKDIILLDYYVFRIPTFKCDWANIVIGVKVDDGFTLVNLYHGQSQFEKDPCIQASQAKEVCYSRESKTFNWYVVVKSPPRGFYDLESYNEATYVLSTTLDAFRVDFSHSDDDDDDDYAYLRMDCEGVEVSCK